MLIIYIIIIYVVCSASIAVSIQLLQCIISATKYDTFNMVNVDIGAFIFFNIHPEFYHIFTKSQYMYKKRFLNTWSFTGL